MTEAISAFGTLIKMGDGGSPESFTTVAEVKAIKGPGFKVDLLDVSNHSSLGAFKEKIAGMIDAGEVTFDINWIPGNPTHSAVNVGILAKMRARRKVNFQVVWPDSAVTTWLLPSIISAFNPDADHTKGLNASITLSVAGQPTLS